MAAAAPADFPADTLLPSRRIETQVPSQTVDAELAYTYARDSLDWLYETATWSDPRIGTEVRITDPQGRYRGGSLLRQGNAPLTYEAVYGPEGLMDQRIVRMGDRMAVEHYRYDAHGNAVEKLTLAGGDTTDREYYPLTYDAQGRIATRKDYDGDSLNSTMVFRYDSLGRPAAQVEYLPPWDLQDSTVYEYRPDGRVLRESHYRQYGGSPWEIVSWEYKVWQVPLALAPRTARGRVRNLANDPGRPAFDVLGRPRRFRALSPAYRHPDRPGRPVSAG